MEDLWMHLLAELHHYEPVPKPEVLHNCHDIVAAAWFWTSAENQISRVLWNDGYDSEAEEDAGPADEDEIPEPEEHVDLFINNVEGENAQTVVIDNRSWRTILVERTFGHLGEDLGHRVDPLLRVHVGDVEDVWPVAGEVAIEEDVHEVHLTHDIHEVEELTKDELVHVQVVGLNVPRDIVGDDMSFPLCGLCISLEGHRAEILQKKLQQSALPVLPQEVRKVASQCLSEQDEDDPLVPGVSDLVTIGRHLDQVPVGGARVGPDPGVGVVQALPPSQLWGQREGAVDPAEGVEQVPGDAVHVTVDGVAEILLGSLQEARDQEDGERVLVVQAKREVVNEASFEFEMSSDTLEEG